MRGSYWMLGVFTFLILALLGFVLYPATALVIGFLLGFAAIYRGGEPAAGTFAIRWSSLTWEWWWITLIAVFFLTIAFVVITRLVHKSARFRKIKVIKNAPSKRI